MPAPQVTTPIYGWRLIRKALSLLDIWDYWAEYEQSMLDVENTVAANVTPLFVTTVADTPYQMTAASPKKLVFEGSASNAPCVLPDATTLVRGRQFEIENASSEYLPVQNFGVASSVFDTLGPKCKLMLTCTGIAAASGIWDTEKKFPENYPRTFLEFDRFQAPTGTSLDGMFCSLGTGSSASNSFEVVYNWGSGVAIVGTDAGLAGFVNARIMGGNPVVAPLNSGKALKAEINFTQLVRGTATDDTVTRFGFHNSIDKLQPSSGVYIETNSTDQLRGIARSAGVETVLPNVQQTKLTNAGGGNSNAVILVNSAATRIDIWIEKLYLGKLASNIPKTANMNAGFQISRVAGVANNRLYIDNLLFERAP